MAGGKPNKICQGAVLCLAQWLHMKSWNKQTNNSHNFVQSRQMAGRPLSPVLERIRTMEPAWADALVACSCDDQSIRCFFWVSQLPQGHQECLHILLDPQSRTKR